MYKQFNLMTENIKKGIYSMISYFKLSFVLVIQLFQLI